MEIKVKKILCPRCMEKLKLEKDKRINITYKYLCTYCDENFYDFEVIIKESKQKIWKGN
jgi:transposase-like protein